MPVDTDAAAWEAASSVPSTREGVRAFLRSNPGRAFTEREIADAVLGTDWAAHHERERLKAELGPAAFRERLDAGEFPDLEGGESLSATVDRRLDTTFVKCHLSALVDAGAVTAKLLPLAAADEPGEEGEVAHYAWSG